MDLRPTLYVLASGKGTPFFCCAGQAKCNMGRKKKLSQQQDGNEIFSQETVLNTDEKQRTVYEGRLTHESILEIENMVKEKIFSLPDLPIEIYIDEEKYCTILVQIKDILRAKSAKFYIGKADKAIAEHTAMTNTICFLKKLS